MNRRLGLWTCVAVTCLLSAFAASAANPHWPSLDEQLAKAKAKKGSALEKLIKDNQDFSKLRDDEADQRAGVPPWLKVFWRKGHPEGTYSADAGMMPPQPQPDVVAPRTARRRR